MDDVHHGTICENVRIVWPRQIGLHLHDCWYGSTRNVEISGARGVALLDDTGNSSTHINMKLVNCWGFWSNATTDCWWDPTETENIAIWTYANTHTDAETQSEYSDYTSDWPSTDVVAAVDRGCIVLKTLQNQCQFDNLSFEPCNYGEYPLIRTRATTTAFRTVRVESGYPNQSSALFVMHEAATTKFENVLVIPTVATGYVIKLSSATSFTTVDTIDCRDSKVLLGVVDASSGSHPHLTVTNCTGTTNGTALVPWCVPLTAITAHKSQNAAPTEIADGNTAITAANLENYILYMASSTGGRAPTVPTGTAMNGILRIGETIEWVFINTGDQVVTITAATGHTLVGDMTLAASESGRFLTRVSAANTAITYRL